MIEARNCGRFYYKGQSERVSESEMKWTCEFCLITMKKLAKVHLTCQLCFRYTRKIRDGVTVTRGNTVIKPFWVEVDGPDSTESHVILYGISIYTAYMLMLFRYMFLFWKRNYLKLLAVTSMDYYNTTLLPSDMNEIEANQEPNTAWNNIFV